MITINQIHWVAGILEGEGSFGLTNKGKSPAIWISMTDADVIERLRNIIDPSMSISITKDERKESYKDSFRFTINSKKAIQWMMIIYSLMSIRRKAKIRDIISAWKIAEINPNLSRKIDLDLRGFSKRLGNMGYSEQQIKLILSIKKMGFTEEESVAQLSKVESIN